MCKELWLRVVLPAWYTQSVGVNLPLQNPCSDECLCVPSARSVLRGFAATVYNDLLAVGMLFEGDLNKFASGSGSIPAAGATYDDITRKVDRTARSARARKGMHTHVHITI